MHMDMLEEKKNANSKKSMRTGLLIFQFSILLIVVSALIIGFNKTGYERYLAANPTPTPEPSFVRTVTPLPIPTEILQHEESESPHENGENNVNSNESYVKTQINIDGEIFAVLASRQAAEDLIDHVVKEFELKCAQSRVTSSIDNEIEFIQAEESAECISYDEAFAILTGETTPIEVTSKCVGYETIVVEHEITVTESYDYYLGTRIVKSYGRDGKNRRILEYTYKNGELISNSITEEISLYPAIMESIIVGVRPIPYGDTTDPLFDKENCPVLDKNFRSPFKGEIIKNFGFFDGIFHNGIDYEINNGLSCKAVNAGRIIAVMERGAYGLTIDIDHGDGVITRYAGLARASVDIGDLVSISDTIGFMGDTSLHFELIINGIPRNPRVYLPTDN